MTYEDFISRFESRSMTPRGAMVKCPAHEDSKASLSIGPAHDGGVVLKCFAGCKAEDIVKAMGLTMKDLFAKEIPRRFDPAFLKPPRPSTDPEPEPTAKNGNGNGNHGPKPTIDKTYSYTDALGRELYQVVRLKPKDFRQRHMVDGKWVWNMTGVERVLYRLPEIIQAEQVWVVEGEKDADNLASLGFCATCNVSGAGKWLDGYTESLKGKHIILCGDNDEPGRKHIDMIFESISGKAASVRIVKVQSPAKDVSDFILSEGEKAKASLQELVESSVPHIDGVSMPVYSMAEIEPRYRRLVQLSQQVRIDLADWLPSFRDKVRPLTPGTLALIVGGTGIGKCLGKGTPVLKFDGSVVPVETIDAGDLLMGPDSSPRLVRSVCCGKETMYRIDQKNGDSYECNESHILSLQSTNCPERGLTAGNIINISVAEYLKKSKKFKHLYKGYKVGIEFSRRHVPIDPYFMGLWLGDGHSKLASITTGDSEVKEYLNRFAKQNRMFVRRESGAGCEVFHLSRRNKWGSNCVIFGCKKPHSSGGFCKDHYEWHRRRNKGFSSYDGCGLDVLSILRSLNVIQNKHIPSVFKCNSRERRLKLLAGLIDSDGYSNEYGVGFCNTNERLANDVLWLARSLGFKATINTKTAQLKSIGYSCKCFVITIGGEVSKIPVLLKRKLGKDSVKYLSLRCGISVEPIGHGDYYGFELEGDGLFLLGDFTVTHNTVFLQSIAMCMKQFKTLMFELELADEDLFERFVANAKDVECRQVEIEYQQNDWAFGPKVMNEMFPNLFICPKPKLTIEQMENIILKSELKIGAKPLLVLLDYAQLMQGEGKSRYERMSNIAEGLKTLAKSTKTVVIVASQVDRTSAKEKDIGLHSGKDSGSLENSAGLVLSAQRDGKDPSVMTIRVLKATKGGAGLEIACNFDGARAKISERSKIETEEVELPL